jgi:hypothetical protein
MNFCGFCGKGPFSSYAGLKRHIGHSRNCNEAANQKWGTYAKNIWENAPNPPNPDKEAPASSPSLGDDELADMPDIYLENDLQGLEEDIANGNLNESQPEGVNPRDPEIPLVRAAVEEAVDEDRSSTCFIEDFPANFGAGAVWGEEIPIFEKLRQEQDEKNASRWGPFEDQDEWDLARWLIRNTGQNQTNAFLNLKIVRSHHLFVFILSERYLKDTRSNKAFISQQPCFS